MQVIGKRFLPSLNNNKYANARALPKFDWGVKTDSYTPIVNLEFVTKIIKFSGKRERCKLCLLEKKKKSSKILTV